jgi:cytochrome c-type biogenesis protein
VDEDPADERGEPDISGVQQLVFSGPLILAAPIAAAAGAITFISPCCLPLVPGYLAYATGMSGTDAQNSDIEGSGRGRRSAAAAAGQDGGGVATATVTTVSAPPARPGRGRTILGTLLFVLGFSALFATYGAASGSLGGSLLAHHQTGLTQVLGAVTIVLGLLFAGLLDRFSFAGRVLRPSMRPRAGLAGAPVLGVMFGLGWTPCIGPTLATVLALSSTTGTATRGAFLAFIYGLGLGVPFLIVSVAFQRSMRVFAYARRHARLVTRIGGALLVVVGVLEVTGAWASAMTWLKIHWIGGYQPPL